MVVMISSLGDRFDVFGARRPRTGVMQAAMCRAGVCAGLARRTSSAASPSNRFWPYLKANAAAGAVKACGYTARLFDLFGADVRAAQPNSDGHSGAKIAFAHRQLGFVALETNAHRPRSVSQNQRLAERPPER